MAWNNNMNPNNELVEIARSKIGKPFLHHFKPNKCNGGKYTITSCMESGMDDRGYDCMGLVIHGLSKILDIAVNDWPTQYRHNLQLYEFSDNDTPVYGDVLLIESKSEDTGIQYATHSGIYIDERTLIHANGRTKIVDASPIMGIVTSVSRISTKYALAELEKIL